MKSILILGGGNAGISLASRMKKEIPGAVISIVEPSEVHYYQPAWTLVGAGIYRAEDTVRSMSSVMPSGVKWIKKSAIDFDPENQEIILNDNTRESYDYLIAAVGLKVNWESIKGLQDALGVHNVCSIYDYKLASYTYDCIKNFKGGKAVFTQPHTPVKCGGASQKIMYLAADYFRKHGLGAKSKLEFWSGGTRVFGVEKYENTLKKVIERYGIQTYFKVKLTEVDGANKKATFEGFGHDKKEQVYEVHFDMLHVVPPQGPPDFIAQSSIADAQGWVSVDKHTLQHTKWPNIFALGDCAGIPVSRTGASIRKQVPVLIQNLKDVMAGKTPTAQYNGYASCPLITGYGKLVLAEFDYNLNPQETFPFDQSKERWSMFMLKKYILPWLYWNRILPGKM